MSPERFPRQPRSKKHLFKNLFFLGCLALAATGVPLTTVGSNSKPEASDQVVTSADYSKVEADIKRPYNLRIKEELRIVRIYSGEAFKNGILSGYSANIPYKLVENLLILKR